MTRGRVGNGNGTNSNAMCNVNMLCNVARACPTHTTNKRPPNARHTQINFQILSTIVDILSSSVNVNWSTSTFKTLTLIIKLILN